MSATTTEVSSVAESLGAYASTVDERTLEILEQRRAGSVPRRGWLVRRALAAADIAGLGLAFVLAQWLLGGGESISGADESVLFLATLPAWIVVAKLHGLYDRDEERNDHSTADDVAGVFHMVTVGAWLFFAGAWLTDLADPQIEKVIVFWFLAVALVPTARAVGRACCRRHVAYVQNTIIVGAGDVGQTIARKVLNHPEYGINIVGFVDDMPKERRADLGQLTLLGGTDRLVEMLQLFDVERVVIAFSNDSSEQIVDLVRSLQEQSVQVDIVPRLYELIGPGVGLHTFEGLPVVGLPPTGLSRSSAALKRAFDLALTLPGLLLISPLFAAIAVAIKLDSRGPVFFRQVRMGWGGAFRMWKFRTMWVDADERKHEFAHLNKHLAPGGDARMFKIDDDPRVTRVGRVLRRFELDELPQLFNVVAGQMTLVGPRPLIPEESCEVRDWGERRLDLKPGMTGVWQVLGSSSIAFDEMVNLDYQYVTTWSLWTDVTLVLRTVPLVLSGRRTG